MIVLFFKFLVKRVSGNNISGFPFCTFLYFENSEQGNHVSSENNQDKHTHYSQDKAIVRLLRGDSVPVLL